ncbi:hypothetical protein EV426DRAFT_676274 [Tirmania nivea]|nr:hypothetical protein EV426DRAFT_676274 [Tirmania nivea]
MADYNAANSPNSQYQFPLVQQPPPQPAPPLPHQAPQQPYQQSRSGKAAMAFARFTQPFGIGGIAGSRPPSSSGTGTPGGGANAPRSTSATATANTRLTSRTTELALDSPVQAISANQECDRLVVAGRDFLKIVTVTDDTLSESTQSLRAQNSNRRGFIQNEVKWGNHPARDLIATAATNGSIVLYRDFRHDRILQEHHRQVNRLAFNAADGRLFLSASQDGSVKLWDLRERKSRITFVGKSEEVRDVQFNEANAVEFVAGYENGCVQRWDYRNPSVCERKISNAHQGPVYSVAWHPDGKHCASGGRDKTVKVWDFYADPRRKSKHTVFTQTSLGRVVWRPGGLSTTELATCSIGNDYKIYGWDLRRPYMPSWVLMEHGNTITGLQFRDEDVLWSGGKDCLLVQHDVCFGHAPVGDLPMVAFAWNSEDEFTFAAQRRKRNESTGGPRGGSGGGRSGVRVHLDPDDYHQVRSGSSSAGAPEDSRNRKGGSRSSSFRRDIKPAQQTSALDTFLEKYQPAQATARVNLPVFNFDKFDFLAKHYITTLRDGRGFTIDKACERNARAAMYVGEYRTAKTWQVLGYLLTREDEARAERAEQERLRKAQEAYNAAFVPGGGAIVARRLLGLGGAQYTMNPGATPMQRPVPDTPKPTPMPMPVQGENVINIEEALSLPPAAFGAGGRGGGGGSVSVPSSTASTDGDSSPRMLDDDDDQRPGEGESYVGGETEMVVGGSRLATSPKPILSVDTGAHSNSHHHYNRHTRNNTHTQQRRDSTQPQEHPPDSSTAVFLSTSGETADVLSSLERDRDPNIPSTVSEEGSYEQPVIRTRPRQYSIGLMSEQTSGSYEERILGLGSEREDNGEGSGGSGESGGRQGGLHAIMEEGNGLGSGHNGGVNGSTYLSGRNGHENGNSAHAPPLPYPHQNNHNNNSTHTLDVLATGSTSTLHPTATSPAPWYRTHAPPLLPAIPTLHLNGYPSHPSPQPSITPRPGSHQLHRPYPTYPPTSPPAFPSSDPNTPWSPQSLLPQLQTYYTTHGDVQFLTTLTNLLYPRYTFPKRAVDDWTEGYISLLARKHMWAVAAKVRKYTGSGVVRRGGQTDTHISGSCGWCGRGIVLGGGVGGGGGEEGGGMGGIKGGGGRRGLRWCESCRRMQDGCVICRKGVAGRWVLCGICGHGGHEGCLRGWFFGDCQKTDKTDEEENSETVGGKVAGVGGVREEGGGKDREEREGKEGTWEGEVDGDEEEMEVCAAVGCGHQCLPRYLG